MATAPTVPNFEQYNFSLNDTSEVITKDNGRNAALIEFGQGLEGMVESINQDLTAMEGYKGDAETAATTATEKAGEATTAANQAGADRTHIDEQRQAIDTKADEVEQSRQAAADSAQSASEDADRAEAAVSTLPDGTVNDSITSETDTWSSQKLDSLLGDIGAVLDEINGEAA